MWWQILLVLILWIVCSFAAGFVWAFAFRKRPARSYGERRDRPADSHSVTSSQARKWVPVPNHEDVCMVHHCYGQKAASVQAPVAVRVIAPIPRAPKR